MCVSIYTYQYTDNQRRSMQKHYKQTDEEQEVGVPGNVIYRSARGTMCLGSSKNNLGILRNVFF